jgi:hypothetical protein
MSFQIIHTGKGQTRSIESPSYADPTVEAPREKQRLSGVAKFYLRQPVHRQVERLQCAHTGYKPGKLLDLGPDQCRFIAGEERIMCGAKTIKSQTSSSYCEHHLSIMYKKGGQKP